jgi:hypothetical protein
MRLPNGAEGKPPPQLVPAKRNVQKVPAASKPLRRRSPLRVPFTKWAFGPALAIPRANNPLRSCAVVGCVFSSVLVKKRSRSERLLEDALDALTAALTEGGAAWMIIGGIAVIARGVRRFTTDIDAAVRGDGVTIETLIAALARQEIVPRIDDAREFAELNLVLLLRHLPTGVDLDVSLAWSAFEHEALEAATIAKFGRTSARMATPSALVVLKALAGRPRDYEDVEALLVLHPGINLDEVRAHIAKLASLADAPELVLAFEQSVHRVLPGVGLTTPSITKHVSTRRKKTTRSGKKASGKKPSARSGKKPSARTGKKPSAKRDK